MSALVGAGLGAPPSAAVLPAVWKLLRLRWVIFASGFRRAKLGRKIGTDMLGLAIVSSRPSTSMATGDFSSREAMERRMSASKLARSS